MAEEPLRVIALDVGERRIGVAATDALGLTVQTLPHLARGRARAGDLAIIAALVRDRAATRVIVGHPLGLDGRPGAAARRIEKFVDALRAVLDVPCELADERYTTVEAERSLVEAGVRRADRRGLVDSMAAALLLETWLRRTRPARDRDRDHDRDRDRDRDSAEDPTE